MKTSSFVIIYGKGGNHGKKIYQNEQTGIRSAGNNSQSDIKKNEAERRGRSFITIVPEGENNCPENKKTWRYSDSARKPTALIPINVPAALAIFLLTELIPL